MILFQHSPLLRRLAPQIILAGTLTLLCAQAQQHIAPSTATVSGVVTDSSGALVTTATVKLESAIVGENLSMTTTRGGRFILRVQPNRPYLITVTAPGFAQYAETDVQVQPDKSLSLYIRLKVAEQALQINVDEDNLDSTDPTRNGDSLTLRGAAIDQLPLDSAQLLQQLEAMSGGSSPDVFINGFSGGALPPRNTIREIRINPNPYSAQYDTTPGSGRIEVFTKPGTGQFHGDFYSFGNSSEFNTQDPFGTTQPSYYSYATYASLGGPLSKNTSFFSSGGRTAGQDNSLVNALVLDTNNQPIALRSAVSTPSTTLNFSTRLDAALGSRSTFIVRYTVSQATQTNAGIGQLALASQGFSGFTTNQSLQLSNSLIFSPRLVNDTRFQYSRDRDRQTPASTAPTIVVAGAFTGGGNPSANYNDNQDHYELQNYVSRSDSHQFFTFGGRFRATRDANHSQTNYNGTYTFACLDLSSTCTANAYRQTLLATSGKGATQFSITQGNPNFAVTVADTSLFFQDDWKARRNLTVSAGLRFESQNHIADHADWAPRFGLAWSPSPSKDKPGQYTVRGGVGIFYQRFTSSSVLQAERQNGISQQQLIITKPTFFCPDLSVCNVLLGGATSQSTTYQIAPDFHSPYAISATASLERHIGTHGSVTATWLGIRGVHNQLLRNINAPLPGSYNPAIASSGTRPLGGTQNIYQYSSEGVYRTNRLNTYFSLNFHNIVTYGNYFLQTQESDANNKFASNSYNIGADYGRASTDIRHQAYLGLALSLPLDFRLNTFVRVHSGAPFNITVNEDLNGDSIFNDRPAFATDLTRPSVIKTQLGNFDTSPMAAQTVIPINYGHGPGYFVVDVNLGKSFNFGPAVQPPPGTPAPKLAPGQKTSVSRRYSLDIAVDGQNLFNQVNLGPPVGTLGSPLFGRSISSASGNNATSANRVVELSTQLRF